MSFVPAACMIACLVVTALAAFTDARTGHIPNWITLPPLAVAPLVWFLYGGVWRGDWRGSLVQSLAGILACGAVPYFLFRARAMGAGDVKLFACIGALLLTANGVEAEWFAICAGALFALAQLAWQGKLLRTLGNSVMLLVNPILPRARRRPVARELMTKIRFGVAIFVGTLVEALARQFHGSVL